MSENNGLVRGLGQKDVDELSWVADVLREGSENGIGLTSYELQDLAGVIRSKLPEPIVQHGYLMEFSADGRQYFVPAEKLREFRDAHDALARSLLAEVVVENYSVPKNRRAWV